VFAGPVQVGFFAIFGTVEATAKVTVNTIGISSDERTKSSAAEDPEARLELEAVDKS
jgi:hypothetical protein